MIDDSHILPPPSTPPPRPPNRSEQPVGVQFATPKKRRPPRKDATIVSRPDAALRQRVLEEELRKLKEAHSHSYHLGPHEEETEDVEMVDLEPPSRSADDTEEHDSQPAQVVDDPPQDPSTVLPRRVQPDEDSQKLYGSWLALIPMLVPPYLQYMQDAQGRMGQPVFTQQKFSCPSGKCTVKESSILCLHFD
ncbi:hypothetical protein TRAPUB_4175, partial [Trametes pubescens]